MTSPFVTRQKVLGDNETRVSFNTWQESLLFHINNEPKFARFISDENQWEPASTENRGFVDDTEEIGGTKMTAKNKLINLRVLLGYISIHAPIISSTFIKEEACSIEEIFERLRGYYDCKKSGIKITELLEFKLESMESREALWERVYSFMEDSLITVASGVLHKGKVVRADEQLTPTLLNISVIIWLDAIHRGLPSLVKQRFAIPLRNTTIYSIRNEISDAVPSLLRELGDREGTISYASSNYKKNRQDKYKIRQKNRPKCCLCEAAARAGADTHYFQTCPFLPSGDRKYLKSKINDIEIESDSEIEDEYQYSNSKTINVNPKTKSDTSNINRVEIITSPCMEVAIGDEEGDITLDTGAESNLVKKSEARRLKLDIKPTSHRATMADGVTPMDVAGEVHFLAKRTCPITKKTHSFQFDGLVVNILNCSILGGMPFLDKNDVYVRANLNTVYVGNCCDFKYASIHRCSAVRAAKIMRVPRQMCILPGSSISLLTPPEYHDKEISVEPRLLSDKSSWIKCCVTKPTNGEITLINETTSPVLVKRHEHLCQIRHTIDMPINQNCDTLPKPNIYTTSDIDRSTEVTVDPSDILNYEDRQRIKNINKKYNLVFSPSLGCYNGRSGKFRHRINMSDSLPPQRRGRVPMYNRSNLEDLQAKFDELHKQGVFIRPEELEITAEYVSPSFLVRKQSGGHRLVTAFAELSEYAKPQPSLMPKVEDIIQQIAQYKYIIKADLTQAYYQIPLEKSSIKYVGVCTPFRGMYVYTRAVMGLPGSESALEQLLSMILGDLMVDGSVIKLADDLYIGADTPSELINIWENVLQLLQHNNLRLSPSKTICCPTTTEVLGWQWKQGTLQATSHRLNTLAACNQPQTITQLRSFIGSYKFLSKVIPKHSDMLAPLDKICATGSPKDKVIWSEELEDVFRKAKEHLKQAKVLTLPTREDKLQIITDAASSTAGLASSLYVIRGKQSYLAGLFNARKTSNQAGWLACEIEALSIAAGIKHFSPYIIQSAHVTTVLTDSRPCVQAYAKLMRGAFSSSSRVNTFLATISRSHVKLSHISGSDNITSDYASRNTIPCNGSCQICKFISELETSVVQEISVSDILSGKCPIPYTTRNTWIQAQQECPDLQVVYRLLKDGRVPSKKKKGLTNVKKYLQHCKLSTSPPDGLIIVMQEKALTPSRQRIVVPKSVLDGLLTALHLQLNHPSKHQLKQIFARGFFALNSEIAINNTVEGCHTCASLKSVPSQFRDQTTSIPPDKIGKWYAGDVIKRQGQLIFLLRENISSLTEGTLIPNEKSQALRDGLLRTALRFRSPSGDSITIRIDGATGFLPLIDDPTMKSLHINLEIGEAKNINRNPIAERAISEFHNELCKLKPSGGTITETDLSIILANMNSRIRQSGYSATEVWTQRDMVSGDKIVINDKSLIQNKYESRTKQHLPSAKYKSRGHGARNPAKLKVGDIIYLFQDRDKWKGRDRYMIMNILEDEMCYVQKLTDKQFRGKKYKVKFSDIIKVYNQESSLEEEDGLELNCGPVKDTNDTNDEHQSNESDSTNSDIDESETSLNSDIPYLPDDSDIPSSEEDQHHSPEAGPIRRRSTREKKPPKHLENFVLDM